VSTRKQVVNVPSFVVRLDSQKHIDFALNSPDGGGRPGRVKRKRAAVAAVAAAVAAVHEPGDLRKRSSPLQYLLRRNTIALRM
jgi:hypothetical protein